MRVMSLRRTPRAQRLKHFKIDPPGLKVQARFKSSSMSATMVEPLAWACVCMPLFSTLCVLYHAQPWVCNSVSLATDACWPFLNCRCARLQSSVWPTTCVEWKVQASHPPNPLVWGLLYVKIEYFNRDWKFQARLKISSEIDSFQSLGPQEMVIWKVALN